MIDSARMRRGSIAAILFLAALAGCGGSDEPTARETAQAYVQARNQGDAAKVCELYSEQLIRSLKTSNCVAFVQQQTSGTATDLALLRVSENGDRARATIQARANGQVANAIAPIVVTLTRQDGEWRISAFRGPGG